MLLCIDPQLGHEGEQRHGQQCRARNDHSWKEVEIRVECSVRGQIRTPIEPADLWLRQVIRWVEDVETDHYSRHALLDEEIEVETGVFQRVRDAAFWQHIE